MDDKSRTLMMLLAVLSHLLDVLIKQQNWGKDSLRTKVWLYFYLDSNQASVFFLVISQHRRIFIVCSRIHSTSLQTPH